MVHRSESQGIKTSNKSKAGTGDYNNTNITTISRVAIDMANLSSAYITQLPDATEIMTHPEIISKAPSIIGITKEKLENHKPTAIPFEGLRTSHKPPQFSEETAVIVSVSVMTVILFTSIVVGFISYKLRTKLRCLIFQRKTYTARHQRHNITTDLEKVDVCRGQSLTYINQIKEQTRVQQHHDNTYNEIDDEIYDEIREVDEESNISHTPVLGANGSERQQQNDSGIYVTNPRCVNLSEACL